MSRIDSTWDLPDRTLAKADGFRIYQAFAKSP